MQEVEEILEHLYWGNTPREWLIAGIIAAVVCAALWGAELFVTRRFSKLAANSRFTFDDVVVATVRATRFWFTLLVGVWAGSLGLELEPTTRERLRTVVQLGIILQTAFWGFAAIRAWVRSYADRRRSSDPSAVTTMRAVGLVGRLVLAAILVIAALDTLGVAIAPLLAGLGIGGVAVALAVQNILGDLFASLSIVLDKPFVLGDFIVVGSEMGTVEHIGLKTTRVRSITGEQLIFGNSDLLASRVRNMKRMNERRVVFTLGVTYQTPRPRLAEIGSRVGQIVAAHPDTRFDRGHMTGYGASSIDFEFVYFMKDPDFNLYRDRHQAILLAIHEYFERERIEFAYPTTTVFLAGSEPARGLPL